MITPLRRYNPQRDLAPRLRPQTRWQPKSNVLIEIALPGPAGRLAPDVVFRTNTPRVKGGLENKAKPKNQFIYAVMKTIANAGGEAKEWIDILAEASDYISGSLITPKEYRDGNRETAAKAWWLFRAGGINNLDFELLAELIVANEVEDTIYGALGQLSKSAGRGLGLTVGPQTGLVM